MKFHYICKQFKLRRVLRAFKLDVNSNIIGCHFIQSMSTCEEFKNTNNKVNLKSD